MSIIYSCYAKKHEYNRFRRAGHHFQSVFYGCMRFLWYIRFHVIFHCNTTKCYANVGQTQMERENETERINLCQNQIKCKMIQSWAHAWTSNLQKGTVNVCVTCTCWSKWIYIDWSEGWDVMWCDSMWWVQVVWIKRSYLGKHRVYWFDDFEWSKVYDNHCTYDIIPLKCNISAFK